MPRDGELPPEQPRPKTAEEIRQQQTYQLAANNIELEVALTLTRQQLAAANQRIAELEARLSADRSTPAAVPTI